MTLMTTTMRFSMPNDTTGTLTVSEVARRLGCRPRDISAVFYDRELSDAACPIIGGRRRIPTALIPAIEAALAKRRAASGARQTGAVTQPTAVSQSPNGTEAASSPS